MYEFLEGSGSKKSIKRNDFIKFPNSIDTNVYYVNDGAIKIFVLDEEMEQIIRFGYKGSIVVALDSYFTGQSSQLGIQAIRNSTITIIPKSEIEGFFRNGQLPLHDWDSLLEDLILQQFEREIDILTSSPKTRYLRVLQRSPQLFQQIPLKYIANYLRMTPETLSRLRNS